jgi:arylsulfatase A-like enzyme
VPLVVRPPGPPGAAVVEDRLVSLIDLLPTVADLIGLPLPEGTAPDGLGFASLLDPAAPERPPRDHLVLHSEAGVFGLRAGAWKLIEGTEGSGGWPPPAGGPPVPGAPGQLYDLASDPGETTNRFADRPDLVRRLEALLDAERRGDPPPS